MRLCPKGSLSFHLSLVVLPLIESHHAITDVLLLLKTFALMRVAAVKRLLEAVTPTATAAGRRRPTRIPRISPSVTRGSANVRGDGNTTGIYNSRGGDCPTETAPCFI